MKIILAFLILLLLSMASSISISGKVEPKISEVTTTTVSGTTIIIKSKE